MVQPVMHALIATLLPSADAEFVATRMERKHYATIHGTRSSF